MTTPFHNMPLTTQPFASLPEMNTLRQRLMTNVAFPERVGSVAGGAALLLYGASRRSLGGLLLSVIGGAMIRRGYTGHCDLYQKLGVNSSQLQVESGVPGDKGIKVVKTVTVSRAPDVVYRVWRKLENLPRFMPHIEHVREMDKRRSHWKVKGPVGSTVEWNAEIITDHPGKMLAWQSLPGAEVQNAGSVWFEAAGEGRTEVKVSLQYLPPAGVLGALVAKMFGEDPEKQLTEDLGRFKELVESGEAHP